MPARLHYPRTREGRASRGARGLRGLLAVLVLSATSVVVSAGPAAAAGYWTAERCDTDTKTNYVTHDGGNRILVRVNARACWRTHVVNGVADCAYLTRWDFWRSSSEGGTSLIDFLHGDVYSQMSWRRDITVANNRTTTGCGFLRPDDSGYVQVTETWGGNYGMDVLGFDVYAKPRYKIRMAAVSRVTNVDYEYGVTITKAGDWTYN